MTRLLVATLVLAAGCSTQVPNPPPRCPLLPDPPVRPTIQQLDAYTAQLVVLYGQCAGAAR